MTPEWAKSFLIFSIGILLSDHSENHTFVIVNSTTTAAPAIGVATAAALKEAASIYQHIYILVLFNVHRCILIMGKIEQQRQQRQRQQQQQRRQRQQQITE